MDSNSKIQMKVANSGGNATSAGLTFHRNPELYWTGEVSSNISNPANWCPNLPDENTNVIFRTSSASIYDPVLDTDAYFKSIHIEAGAMWI